MSGWLRRLLAPARPAAQAPLQGLTWDGTAATLEFAAGTSGRVALDVDGVHFTDCAFDGAEPLRVAVPFSPSGADTLQLMPRLGRGGQPLLSMPLQVSIGRPGATPARTAPSEGFPPPLPAPARCLPFGSDMGALAVTVVVPVHNAAALVERCLASVLAHTTGRARLLVIDDASTDPAIAPLLARCTGLARVRVLRNPQNLGFTATANRGIAEAGADDVVLLNADAEVGPQWLSGLRRAACAAEDIATATAVSDNAGAFSVPELEQANALPAAWPFAASARALWQHAGLAYPELPTGNGFCLYIRRTAIDAVGALDAAAFPQGYGEENDFCQRAARAGMRHVVAGNVLVRHARSASFGDARRAALGAAGMAVLRERWPAYERDVGATLFSFERRVLDWRVRRVFAAARADNAPLPRLLWVGEDAPAWPDAEVWTLRARGERNEFVRGGEVMAWNRWDARDPEASYRALWNWLQVFAIDGLVEPARKGDSAAAILCRLLGIPVVEVALPLDPSARAALDRAESSLRSFPDLPE